MGAEGVPPGLWERIRSMIREEVGKLLKSGLLRNASISEGGLTIKGGFLRLLHGSFNLFYVGPSGLPLGDGTLQQTIRMRRADGSMALQIHDSYPAPDGTLNQAMTWFDRSGNAVFADDTDGGVGVARPHLSGGFARNRFEDMTVQTTSATFETLFTQRVTKQQPRLEVWYRASMDTPETTGEVRILVNGAQLDSTEPHGFAIATILKGPAVVAGQHMATLIVEIQGRRTSATGALRVEALSWFGRQT